MKETQFNSTKGLMGQQKIKLNMIYFGSITMKICSKFLYIIYLSNTNKITVKYACKMVM